MRLNPALHRLAPIALTVFVLAALPAAAQPLNEDVRLNAVDPGRFDRFGASVAISGNTAIVGAYLDDDSGSDAGSAYLFNTTTGMTIAKLTASDAAPGDHFGFSVAIFGNTAIAGAPFGNSNRGAAYLFDATTGQQIAKLTASDAGPDDQFGFSVAISEALAVVGSPLDGSASGSVYLFDSPSGLQKARVTAPDIDLNDQFGFSVAISGDIAIFGARFDSDAGPGSGSAYLFDTVAGQHIAKLTASDAAPLDNFGTSVAISGTTAVVGSPNDSDAGPSSGSAYIFDTTTGERIAKLTAPDAQELDMFGSSVGISAPFVIVGARLDRVVGSFTGSAYLFDPVTGGLITKLLASDGAFTEGFGASISISGSTAIVGSPFNDGALSDSGSAYIFKGTAMIIAQPQSDIVDLGASATFRVEVANPAAVSYQWRRNGINLADGNNISGSKTATLQIIATATEPAFYDCVLTRWGLSGPTQQVVLGVRPDPDACFVDVNGDDIVNFFDVLLFINAFNAGCP